MNKPKLSLVPDTGIEVETQEDWNARREKRLSDSGVTLDQFGLISEMLTELIERALRKYESA